MMNMIITTMEMVTLNSPHLQVYYAQVTNQRDLKIVWINMISFKRNSGDPKMMIQRNL